MMFLGLKSLTDYVISANKCLRTTDSQKPDYVISPIRSITL
uniref:Uncharacterized protein n=1 Tax=Manihot esculenta TaxID=3983 RepID=A0A2C9V7H6_MANES